MANRNLEEWLAAQQEAKAQRDLALLTGGLDPSLPTSTPLANFSALDTSDPSNTLGMNERYDLAQAVAPDKVGGGFSKTSDIANAAGDTTLASSGGNPYALAVGGALKAVGIGAGIVAGNEQDKENRRAANETDRLAFNQRLRDWYAAQEARRRQHDAERSGASSLAGSDLAAKRMAWERSHAGLGDS